MADNGAPAMSMRELRHREIIVTSGPLSRFKSQKRKMGGKGLTTSEMALLPSHHQVFPANPLQIQEVVRDSKRQPRLWS